MLEYEEVTELISCWKKGTKSIPVYIGLHTAIDKTYIACMWLNICLKFFVSLYAMEESNKKFLHRFLSTLIF